MNLKDSYRQKMEAQFDEYRARLELLKAQARVAVADGQIMTYEELAEAEAKLASAQTRLKVFAEASEGAWEEMKAGIESAWDSLKAASEKAADRFK